MTDLEQDDGVELMNLLRSIFVRHGLADLSFDPFINGTCKPPIKPVYSNKRYFAVLKTQLELVDYSVLSITA